jgi:NAD+ synthase (glutamine-hydrolysing)
VLTLGLPSRYTSALSLEDAQALSATLGIEYKVLSIENPFQSYLDLLNIDFQGHPVDITEENIQARIRGTILMAFSNKLGYLLLNTGNKSEMAMGYCTLYGDMCGGLAVISDVFKTQIYALANFINRHQEVIACSIINRPPTAELRANQKDTDTLPQYDLLDKILQSYIEELEEAPQIAEKLECALYLVKEVIEKVHLNEYKRRQAPPGLRVTKQAFSVGRRFPIIQQWKM